MKFRDALISHPYVTQAKTTQSLVRAKYFTINNLNKPVGALGSRLTSFMQNIKSTNVHLNAVQDV